MIRRLDRYVLKEMVGPFFIGCFILVLLFQANDLIYVFKTYPDAKIPPLALLKFLAYRTPNFLGMTLPAGVAMASSLTMARLVRESELTAFRSAGIPVRRVLVPVLVGGLLLSGMSYYAMEILNPAALKASHKLEGEVGMLNLVSANFVANRAITLNNGTLIYVENLRKLSDKKMELTNPLMIEHHGPESIITSAPNGTYEDGVWTMQNVIVRFLNGTNTISCKSGGTATINEKIEVPDIFNASLPEEKSLSELGKSIAEKKRNGARPADYIESEVSYYQRFSLPLACVVFSLTGSVVSILFAKQGPFAGVIWSLGLVMIYFNAFVISQKILAPYHIVSPWLGAFLPDLLFLAVGVFYLRRVE